LTLLNNEFTLIQADYFAGRVWKTAGSDPAKQIDEMYRVAFSRPPTESEMRTNMSFLQKQAASATPRAALTDLAHVVLNLNEFVYLK